jgi:hypothetical protein
VFGVSTLCSIHFLLLKKIKYSVGPLVFYDLKVYASKQKLTKAFIDSGVTPSLEDFVNQPTPIHNTTLKGMAGGLTDPGRGTIQLKVKQKDKDPIILIIDNVIYAPDCPVQLLSPQQLYRQSKAKGQNNTIPRGRHHIMKLPPQKNTGNQLHSTIKR